MTTEQIKTRILNELTARCGEQFSFTTNPNARINKSDNTATPIDFDYISQMIADHDRELTDASCPEDKRQELVEQMTVNTVNFLIDSFDRLDKYKSSLAKL